MRIACPFCGDRDVGEFIYRGSDPGAFPTGDSPEAVFDHVYLRDNHAGPIAELWYHAMGCRSWLRVTRDTLTHQVCDVALAREGNE